MDASKIEVSGIMTGIRSLADGGLALSFHTNELNPDEKAVVIGKHGKFGYLLFSENQIQPKDVPTHDAEVSGKSPSQRLRGVLFVLHSQMKAGGKTSAKFEDFYNGQLENIINQYKEKLDPL